MAIVKILGIISAAAMPLWNIPLIMKIIKRRSSRDISKVWVLGVWVCIIGMAPSGFVSQDIVLKTFSIANLIFFSCVVFVVMMYGERK